MSEAFVLALDQGTTSSRAIVFRADGSLEGIAQQPFPQLFPQDGWVEHEPEAIWETQLTVAREAIANSGLRVEDISAVGITNQRETTLLWERSSGRPVGNAIVWQDRRTAAFCEALRARNLEPMFAERTGLLLDPYFSGTKLRWLLDEVPGARDRAERGDLAFGTVDSWLIWRLTGGREHLTDVTNASRTLLFNIRTLRWDQDLLETLEIPSAVLPRVVPSAGRIAEIDPSLFGRKLLLTGVAGDQQAALFGQSCLGEGDAKNTYGTGCFILMNTGNQPVTSDHRLLSTVAWQIEGQAPCYALEGSVFTGGAAVQWLRDGLGLIASAADIEPLAATVEDSGGVVFVPALTGLGAPHWDPYARGSLLGITRSTTAAHVARAILEGIAHQCVDVIRAMELDSGVSIQCLRVDGGASENDLLLQLQADLLATSVIRGSVREATAFGAARLAGIGAGVWQEAAQSTPDPTQGHVFTPRAEASTVARARARWSKALERAGHWAGYD